MAELVGLWEELVDLSGGGDQVARMLGLWGPTPYLAGCSQAVWSRGRPVLWLDTRVLVSSDCLWGALDGINEHGLAVSLAFGGDPAVGGGSASPWSSAAFPRTWRTTSPSRTPPRPTRSPTSRRSGRPGSSPTPWR